MEAVLENFMTIEKMVDVIVFDKTGVMFRDRTTEAAEAHIKDFFSAIFQDQFEILAMWRQLTKGDTTETEVARKIGYYALNLMGLLIHLRDDRESCFTKVPLSDYQNMYVRELMELIVSHLEKLHIEGNTGPAGIANVKELSAIANGTSVKINGVKLHYISTSGHVCAVRTEFE